MILNAYCVYDTKSGVFEKPFFAISDGIAIRMFGEVANDRETVVGRHPADFTLFHIGGFDDSQGMLMPAPTPRNLGVALTFVKQPQQAFNLGDNHPSEQ